ncbi:MAG: 4'-phosphopantetheinyl transferase superfamily protein [Peptococcaceae bacterium]|nr:4'-phosphopantetheinyl transferase superfamily protein [Peptococcaceae bacterium]
MQNPIRIGTDIVEFRQIAEETANDPDFVFNLLTKDEMKLYESLGAAERLGFLAGRYAAKEAVLKSISAKKALRYDEVEILPGRDGQPYVVYSMPVREILAREKLHFIEISIARSKNYAVATAVAGRDKR